MEDSAVTLETAMNVSALMATMAAIARLRQMNVWQTRVKMEQPAKT